MVRSLFTSFAVAAAVVAGTPAWAQDAAGSSVVGNIAVTTKYKFRGQDQSDAEKAVLPAVQGGFDFTSGSFYLGNWNSSIGFAGGTEMDFYGGFRGEVTGLAYDVGLLYYYYPMADSGDPSLNTTEIYASLGFGPMSLKYSHSLSKYFGLTESKNTGYVEFNVNQPIGTGFTLNAHVGYTRLPGDAQTATGLDSYIDYKLGVTYDLGNGFALAGAYVGANKKESWGDTNKGRVVVTLSKAL